MVVPRMMLGMVLKMLMLMIGRMRASLRWILRRIWILRLMVMVLLLRLLLQAKFRLGLRLGAQVQGRRRVRNLEAFARSPGYPLPAQLARFLALLSVSSSTTVAPPRSPPSLA